jgi:hypothetical protein
LSSILREFHQFELKMQAVPRFELFHVQQSRAQGRSYLLMAASSRTCHWRSAGTKSLLAETLEIRGAPSSVPVRHHGRSSVIARKDTRRQSLTQARPLRLSELHHRHARSQGRTTPSRSATSRPRRPCCGTPTWLRAEHGAGSNSARRRRRELGSATAAGGGRARRRVDVAAGEQGAGSTSAQRRQR